MGEGFLISVYLKIVFFQIVLMGEGFLALFPPLAAVVVEERF